MSLQTVINWRKAENEEPGKNDWYVVLLGGFQIGYTSFYAGNDKGCRWGNQHVTHFALPEDITTVELAEDASHAAGSEEGGRTA